MTKLGLTYAGALLLIGIGCGCIYPPSAPIAIGLIVWFDLNRKDSKS